MDEEEREPLREAKIAPKNNQHNYENETKEGPEAGSSSAEAEAVIRKRGNSNEIPKESPDEILFECNICLDTASNPVVTLCGHLVRLIFLMVVLLEMFEFVA
jgi:hypothetical protein